MTFSQRAIPAFPPRLLQAEALPAARGGDPQRPMPKLALVASVFFVAGVACAAQPDPATVGGIDEDRATTHGVEHRVDAYRFRSPLEQNVDVATRGRPAGTSVTQVDSVERTFARSLERLTCEQREEARYRETMRQLDREWCVGDYLNGKIRRDPETIRTAYGYCDSLPSYRSVLHGDLEAYRITLHRQYLSRCDDKTK